MTAPVTGPSDPNRELLIISLLSGGETVQSIADRFSVSRQRVHQIAARNGMTAGWGRYVDPIRICRAAETATSLAEASLAAGASQDQAKRVLVELGKWPKEWNRKWEEDEALDAFRALAAELGRTPKQVDIRGREPSNGVYARLFGTLTETVRRAGLPVRNHRRNKVTPAQRTEIALRFVRCPPGQRDGGNMKELAAEYGICPTRVFQIYRQSPLYEPRSTRATRTPREKCACCGKR